MANALTTTGGTVPAMLTDLDHERIERTKAAARADNTGRAYATQLANFTSWAKRRGIAAALPIDPMTVAAWITERAESGLTWLDLRPGQPAHSRDSLSTLRVAVAAIRAAHTKLGARFDGEHPDLVETLKGVARTAENHGGQAAPLTLEEVALGADDGALLEPLEQSGLLG